MHDSSSSGGVVSEDEVKTLTALFVQFEGASDPLSHECKEAKFAFYVSIGKIFEQKIKPLCSSLTLSHFTSYVRRECRLRASKEGPPFPCV
jgi:hypothetical protein